MEYLLENDKVHNEKEKKIYTYFLFLSNLIESKGVYILLDACFLLKQNGCAYKTLIVGGEGDISEKQLLKRIKKLRLEEDIQYLGKQYGEDKYKIFRKSDVFVFPTFYKNETFGLVNIEAMQFKLPIISCDEGAIRDIVIDGQNGFIIPQKNHIALAEKMEWFMNHPDELKEMGEAGFRFYQEKYTLKVFEKKLVSILLDELDF